MALKFYTSVAKGAKQKVKMILEIIPRFAGIPIFPRFDVTGARGRRGGVRGLPASSATTLNRISGLKPLNSTNGMQYLFSWIIFTGFERKSMFIFLNVGTTFGCVVILYVNIYIYIYMYR